MIHSIRLVLYILVISISIVGIWVAHGEVRELWADTATKYSILQNIPAQASRTDFLEKDLESALSQMDDIRTAITTRDGLVDVISEITISAKRFGVSVQVPTVQENSKSPSPSPAADDVSQESFSSIRIRVIGSGTPTALASYLHYIEHIPYILSIVSWKIDTTQQTSVASFSEIVPSSESVSTVTGSSLSAEIEILMQEELFTKEQL